MTDQHIHIEPIGFFHTYTKEKHRVPRQPDKDLGIHGYILLHKEHNFEQALQDLDSFSHMWIIFQFHQALHAICIGRNHLLIYFLLFLK